MAKRWNGPTPYDEEMQIAESLFRTAENQSQILKAARALTDLALRAEHYTEVMNSPVVVGLYEKLKDRQWAPINWAYCSNCEAQKSEGHTKDCGVHLY